MLHIYGKILGLSEADRASIDIPHDINEGSANEAGYVYGVKVARMGSAFCPDPGLGGSMMSSILRGFKDGKRLFIL